MDESGEVENTTSETENNNGNNESNFVFAGIAP
jgi:hypothetical protein